MGLPFSELSLAKMLVSPNLLVTAKSVPQTTNDKHSRRRNGWRIPPIRCMDEVLLLR
jgi:hypothetical protein